MDISVLIVIALYGLVLGSFLNVLILRSPARILRGTNNMTAEHRFLSVRRSRSMCPHCGVTLRWYHNVPVVSYIALRGRCAECRHPISIQYPVIELTTMAMAIGFASTLGINLNALAYFTFAYLGLALCIVDIRHYLLPDTIVAPLWAAGLIFAGLGAIPVEFADALLGSIVAFVGLGAFVKLYSLIRRKDVMGFGDIKLAGAITSWLGLSAAAPLIFGASVVGLLWAGLAIAASLITNSGQARTFGLAIPFGPSLIVAGTILLVCQYLGFDVRFLL